LLSFAARPMIFVGYFSYFQLNIDYIIETYCVNKDKPEMACNGQCHLSKQLQTTTTEDGSTKAVNSLSESFFPVFIQANEALSFVVTTHYMSLNNSLKNNFYKYQFSTFHLRPPIA
jgi:hypothetical protein